MYCFRQNIAKCGNALANEFVLGFAGISGEVSPQGYMSLKDFATVKAEWRVRTLDFPSSRLSATHLSSGQSNAIDQNSVLDVAYRLYCGKDQTLSRTRFEFFLTVVMDEISRHHQGCEGHFPFVTRNTPPFTHLLFSRRWWKAAVCHSDRGFWIWYLSWLQV